MYTKHSFLLIPFAIICMAMSCKKPPNEGPTELSKLPPITTEGKNTFGCLVNGKAWLPKDGFMDEGLFVDYQDGNLLLRATDNEKTETFYFEFYNNSLIDTGVHPLYDIHGKIFCSYRVKGGDYVVTEKYPSRLYILKLDTEKKIISGTFSFEAIFNNDTTNFVKVTKGRFDVTYN